MNEVMVVWVVVMDSGYDGLEDVWLCAKEDMANYLRDWEEVASFNLFRRYTSSSTFFVRKDEVIL